MICRQIPSTCIGYGDKASPIFLDALAIPFIPFSAPKVNFQTPKLSLNPCAISFNSTIVAASTSNVYGMGNIYYNCSLNVHAKPFYPASGINVFHKRNNIPSNREVASSSQIMINYFLTFTLFCLILSVQLIYSLTCLPKYDNTNEKCSFEIIRNVKLNNPKRVTVGHLNINSIPNKLNGIMDMVRQNLDVFLISETKIDNTFPDAQFVCNGYSNPHRRDRFLGGGGLLMYINENIPSRVLKLHKTPEDIEILSVEINLKKQKWCIVGIYRPPCTQKQYFIDNLSRVVDCYSTKYDNIIILGDFNMEPSDDHMVSLFNSFNLYNLVKECTCFKGPPKCYDLILTNRKHNFQNTLAVTTGFSDFHKLTITVLKTEYVKGDPIYISYRDYKNYNSVNFTDELCKNFKNNVNSYYNYSSFQSILIDVLDKHAPIKKKTLRANHSPFMTKILRKMIMHRSRCKNAYFNNKTVENWEKYRKLRNECVKYTKKAKREYFQNLDCQFLNDNKSFWKTIKPFFTSKGLKSSKVLLVENNEIISDNVKVAEIMNDHFINIATNFVSNIPMLPRDLCGIDPLDTIMLTYRSHPSIVKIRERIKHQKKVLKFSFSNVTPSHIENEIISLNAKKSVGYDNIPPKVLKESVCAVKEPLTLIFNTSVNECTFPSKLKFANISPLFKKDDNTNKKNYRPISILPVVSKIFERVFLQQMSNFVSNIISPYLCGFRKGYSTQHALLRLMNKLNISLDKKHKVGLFMMDLSKAFDCVPHDLLIAKLDAYGFERDALKLIYSYLKDRNQRVKINADYSSWQEILTGVPQGSVLGPLLFNLFLNDIYYFVDKDNLHNYADDNTLSFADMEIEEIIYKLEANINVLNSWFINNAMILNEDKCQFIIIESTRSEISRAEGNKTAAVKVGSKIIEEQRQGKLLGITIDKNINMAEHIKKLCKQASKKLHALARISPYLNEHKRKILMKSFILSQFSYCPIVWMYCQRKSNNLINRIHERSLRIAYCDYVSDFEGLLSKDNSSTIHVKNVQALACEVYSTINNLNPHFMGEIFNKKINNYSLRRPSLRRILPCTVIYGLETFSYRATQIWSSIPVDIQSSNKRSIKRHVKNNRKSICKCNLCKLYVCNLGYIDNPN